MAEPGSHITLTGKAELNFVDQLLEALDQLIQQASDVSAEDHTLFSLAVSEIATNIVTHGRCPGNAQVTVKADLSVRDDVLFAQFKDDAAPVDVVLEEAKLPDELAESGRGLAIAKMALDRLSHEVDDGHTWTLVRKRR